MSTHRPLRGAAAVEFALAGTLLLVVLFGAVDWSWFLYHYLAVVRASERGARRAAATPPAGDPAAEAEAAVGQAMAQFGVAAERVQVTTTLDGAPGAQVVRVEVELSEPALIGTSLVPEAARASTSQRYEAVLPSQPET